MAASPEDIDELNADGLKRLLLQVLEENAALRAEVVALREENRRRKGLKGPPTLKPSKPSGMEKATAAKPGGRGERRGPKNARLVVDEVCIVPAAVPPGSRFKGYEDFVVQDLVVRPRVIRYRRERWQTPAGATVVAPLPPGLAGHYGPELRRFVLAQYHQGQSTVERTTALLKDIGIDISKRQVVRLLIAGQEGFVPRTARCCGRGSPPPPGSASTTPARAMPTATPPAPASATPASPASPHPHQVPAELPGAARRGRVGLRGQPRRRLPTCAPASCRKR